MEYNTACYVLPLDSIQYLTFDEPDSLNLSSKLVGIVSPSNRQRFSAYFKGNLSTFEVDFRLFLAEIYQRDAAGHDRFVGQC